MSRAITKSTTIVRQCILFLLYLSQGAVAGLVGATLPLVLKRHVSYRLVGLLSIAFYPYSLKILWSPIIDATGKSRRRIWIAVSLVISGLGLLIMALCLPTFIRSLVQSRTSAIFLFVAFLLLIVLASATQGAAADGWALTVFPPTQLQYVSVIHNLGMVLEQFGTYAGYLWLSAATIVDHQPSERLLRELVFFWSVGILFIVLPGVLAMTDGSEVPQCRPIRSHYKKAISLLRLDPVQTIIVIHLLSGIPFEAHDSATNLKLLELGLKEAYLAFVSAIDLVFDILATYITSLLCARIEPMRLWCWAYVCRIFAVVMSEVIFSTYSSKNSLSLPMVILEHICSTSTATIMFVSFLTLHLRVSDPEFGSTYMTLLAT